MPPLAPRKQARTEAGEPAPAQRKSVRIAARAGEGAGEGAGAAPPRLVLRFKRVREESPAYVPSEEEAGAAPGAPRKRSREEADEALFQPPWATGGVLPGFEEEEALFQPPWALSPLHLSSLGGGSPSFSLGSLGGSPFVGAGAGAGAAAPLRSDSLMFWARGGSLGGSPLNWGSLGGSPLPPHSPLGAGAGAAAAALSPRSDLDVLAGYCGGSPRIPLAGMAAPPPVPRLRLRWAGSAVRPSDSLGGGAASLGSPLFAAAASPPLYLGSPFRVSSLGAGASPIAQPRFDSLDEGSPGVNLYASLSDASSSQ
jgi:hypothetical protein